jgi:hypothetical protein
MERASLMYAIHMLDADGENSHVMFFFGGFMLVLALMLAASI